MTKQALSLQLTRSGGNSSVGEVDLWRIPPIKNTFPQHVWREVYQADNLYSSTALSGWSKKSTPSNSWNSKNVCARETIRLCNCKCNKSGADPGGGGGGGVDWVSSHPPIG